MRRPGRVTPQQRDGLDMLGRWIERGCPLHPDAHRFQVVTSPHCGHPRHTDEYEGAETALEMSGPWTGETIMDCGCTLVVVPVES